MNNAMSNSSPVRASVLGTVRRKVSKSIAQRGMWGTLVRCLVRPVRYVRSYLYELHPETRRRRREDRQFDEEFCVDTRIDVNLGWLAEIDSPNWVFGRGYSPAPHRSLQATLERLKINYEDFTFIDIGSGKGRSLLVAAEFSFEEIIGVEYAASLCAVAERNFETYSNPRQVCKNLNSVCQDAAEYELPNRPLVLYFYDPFAEPLMRRVTERIHQSMVQHPRPVIVVYYNPVFAEQIADLPKMELAFAGKEFEAYWKNTQRGNKEANEFVSGNRDGDRYAVFMNDLVVHNVPQEGGDHRAAERDV